VEAIDFKPINWNPPPQPAPRTSAAEGVGSVSGGLPRFYGVCLLLADQVRRGLLPRPIILSFRSLLVPIVLVNHPNFFERTVEAACNEEVRDRGFRTIFFINL